MPFFRKQKIKEATKRVAEVLFKEAWEIMDENPEYVIDDAIKHLYLKYTPKEVQELKEFEIPNHEWHILFLTITWIVARKELGFETSTREDFNTAAKSVEEYLNWRFQNPPGWLKI